MKLKKLLLLASVSTAAALNWTVPLCAQETPAKKEEPVLKVAPEAAKPAPQPGAKISSSQSPKDAAPQVQKAPANHPNAVEIINRYLDALGGLKALEAVEDRVMKFRVIKHATTGETVAAMNLYLKKDYKIREEWDIEGLKIKDQPLAFVQVYNGSEGWVQMFGTVSPLEGKTLSLFVWDKYLDDFFCHWEADGYSADYLGAGTVDNEPVDIIETTDFSGGNKARYFFSKASGLLVKREWREQGQQGQGLAKKETFFKRYRKIPFSDGSNRALQVPLLHEIYEDGDLDTSREFKEVTLNTGLKDGIFERPEGEEFKGGTSGVFGEPTAQQKAEATPGRPAHPTVQKPAHPPVTPSVKPTASTPPPAPPAPAPPAQAAAPTKVSASHILFMYKGSARAPASVTRTKEEARKEADGALAELKKDPSRFAALAREKSDCPSRSKGGDLGEFGPGRMTKAFETAAFGLEPGQVSEVVETEFGYHLIRRTQ